MQLEEAKTKSQDVLYDIYENHEKHALKIVEPCWKRLPQSIGSNSMLWNNKNTIIK